MSKPPTRPSDAVVKRLYALSRNRCAFPRCPVAICQDGTLIGEVCHIEATSPGGPRHDLRQSPVDRHSFENLILLCCNHHAVIDADSESYTVERLQKMKFDHEAQSTGLDSELIEQGSRLLIKQAIQSINQSGGITAGTVHINVNPPVSQEAAPTTTDRAELAAVDLRRCSCFEGSGARIAHTDSQDKDGKTNEHVYWHHSPSAWLRIIPLHAKEYGRAALQRLVETVAVPLLPFGESDAARCFSNSKGTAVIGIDGDVPQTVATRVTQVLHTGEIWGLNRAMIEPEAQGSTRTFQIPWPKMKLEFERTLTNYLHFAREALKLDHPLTVVAGLAMVDDAVLIRDKSDWYTNRPKPQRCLERFIPKNWQIGEGDVVNEGMFEEFYRAVWDACTLDYSQEPRIQTWPRNPHQQ